MRPSTPACQWRPFTNQALRSCFKRALEWQPRFGRITCLTPRSCASFSFGSEERPALVFVSNGNESLVGLDGVLCGKGCRSLISQRTVRSLGIIVQSPSLDHNLGFQQRLKPFALQAFISKLVMETFDEAVFPRLPWRNKGGTNLVLFEPGLDGFRRKLAAIIRAQKNGGVSFLEDSRQERDDVLRKDGGCRQDPQTFAGEFIQNAQGFKLPPVRQTVKKDIVSPDMVRILGLLRLTGRFVLFSPFSGTLWRDLKVMLLPEPPGTSKPQAADGAFGATTRRYP